MANPTNSTIVVHVPLELPASTPPAQMHAWAKSMYEHGRSLVAGRSKAPAAFPAPRTQSKRLSTVPNDDALAVANRLSEMLEVDPKTASDEDKEKIFQQIISYRSIARSLPDETRSVLDRKIAAFSNSQIKPKFKKK
jgi:hypothetical protein